MEKGGVDSKMIVEKSIFTPSCGMGSMTPEDARSAMNLLARLQKRVIT
jgi:hypothetical protein